MYGHIQWKAQSLAATGQQEGGFAWSSNFNKTENLDGNEDGRVLMGQHPPRGAWFVCIFEFKRSINFVKKGQVVRLV